MSQLQTHLIIASWAQWDAPLARYWWRRWREREITQFCRRFDQSCTCDRRSFAETLARAKNDHFALGRSCTWRVWTERITDLAQGQ